MLFSFLSLQARERGRPCIITFLREELAEMILLWGFDTKTVDKCSGF
jgi:hypothetical protein